MARVNAGSSKNIILNEEGQFLIGSCPHMRGVQYHFAQVWSTDFFVRWFAAGARLNDTTERRPEEDTIKYAWSLLWPGSSDKHQHAAYLPSSSFS